MISGDTGTNWFMDWMGAFSLGLMAAWQRPSGDGYGCRRFGVAGLLVCVVVIGMIAGASSAQAAEPEQAGTIEELSDRVIAGGPGESVRTLTRGDPVYAGEIVRTGTGARAVVRLGDGTRVSLRPASVFRVAGLGRSRHESDETTRPGLFLDLLRGGLRMFTGSYAHDYWLHTPVGTVATGAAEFDVRLCPRGYCPGTHEEIEAGAAPVARVVQVHGAARAEGVNGAVRVLDTGAGIQREDVVTTADDAWVVLHFVDESKVSLQPGTVLRIDQWTFDRDEPGRARARLDMQRGGIRVSAGLIGSEATGEYRLATPVGTIGVLGKGFDLQCVGDCIDAGIETAHSPEGDGLLLRAWDGGVIARMDDRVFEFAAGQSGFLANAAATLLRLRAAPWSLRQLPAPRPDRVSAALHPPGAEHMYTGVRNGGIIVQGARGPRLGVGPGGAAVIPAGGKAQALIANPDAL